MGIRINDTAPNFTAQTTVGEIDFHDWIGDSWAVLFSHPKDFTPVCTTELGYMASINGEFQKRGVKIIGLSVDPVDRHSLWADDIEETQGTRPNFPMIGDTDFNVSKLYDMLPADVDVFHVDPSQQDAAGFVIDQRRVHEWLRRLKLKENNPAGRSNISRMMSRA